MTYVLSILDYFSTTELEINGSMLIITINAFIVIILEWILVYNYKKEKERLKINNFTIYIVIIILGSLIFLMYKYA